MNLIQAVIFFISGALLFSPLILLFIFFFISSREKFVASFYFGMRDALIGQGYCKECLDRKELIKHSHG